MTRCATAWAVLGGLLAAANGCFGSDTHPSAGTDAPDGSPSQGDDVVFTQGEMAALQTLSPATLPAPPHDASNAHADDPKAAAFGQKLFFDTGLSGRLLDPADNGGPGTLGHMGETGRVACVSCHDPANAFVDTRSPSQQLSLGAGWGRRRARSLLDVGQATLLGWDGRHDALYNMAIGALESPVDMNSSRLYVAQQIFQRYKADYEAVFGPLPPLDDTARFPPVTADQIGCLASVAFTPEPTCTQPPHGVPGDFAEFDNMAYADRLAVTQVAVNMGKALGAYERLLTCGPGRFDAWMHGQSDALSQSEQRGAKLFVGAGGCIACHSGPYLSDEGFHNVGLAPVAVGPEAFVDTNDMGASVGVDQAVNDPLNVHGQFSDGDDGRLPATVTPNMSGAFLIPRLRCVNTHPSFMHTAQLTSLTDVVQLFNRGGDGQGFPGSPDIKPLGLSDQDVADLVAFLGTLDGSGPASALRAP